MSQPDAHGPRARRAAARELTKGMLRPNEQRLLDLIHEVGYGTLTNVHVRGGEVLFEPRPKIRRKRRLGREDSAIPAAGADFKLCRQHRELIAALRRISEAVLTIVIQDGLPVAVEEDFDV